MSHYLRDMTLKEAMLHIQGHQDWVPLGELKTALGLVLIENFNTRNPVGTPVRYWTGFREGEGVLSKTRSEAQLLSGHKPVVWVEGHGSCVALTHVEVVEGGRDD